jgi:transposase InsO family protein
MPNCGPGASASPASGAHEGKQHSAAPAQEAAADHSRHGYGIAPNLLQRAFEADRPNTIWLADITYVATDEGWLYLAAVKDIARSSAGAWPIT